MSAIRQSFVLARSRVAVAQPLAIKRSFVSAGRLAVGKESSLHQEGRKEEIDAAHKKKDSGEWVEELASDSESIAKADRGELGSSGQTIDQLQKETAKLANDKNLDDLEKLKKNK